MHLFSKNLCVLQFYVVICSSRSSTQVGRFFFGGEFTSIIFYRCKTKPSSFIWKKITSILNYIRICILFLSKSFTSNIILKICQKIKEKLSNNRDKTLRKKIIFISDEAGFHRFLYIVIDMIDILFYQYIYFYANICTITV